MNELICLYRAIYIILLLSSRMHQTFALLKPRCSTAKIPWHTVTLRSCKGLQAELSTRTLCTLCAEVNTTDCRNLWES